MFRRRRVSPESAMPILKNAKHELFAVKVANGAAASRAYCQVYKVPVKQGEANGPRLMGNDRVKLRIAEIQRPRATAVKLSLEEKREFLRRAVMTPVGQIDETSDLCESREMTRFGPKFKSVDKLRALEIDAKLAGEFQEKIELQSSDALAALLLSLRNGKD